MFEEVKHITMYAKTNHHKTYYECQIRKNIGWYEPKICRAYHFANMLDFNS